MAFARRTGTLDHTACCNASPAQPASAIPHTFSSSCRVLAQISEPTPKAAPNAMLPAAGTVVTEMKTPVSPPAFVDVSVRTPAVAAMTATMNDHLSGV